MSYIEQFKQKLVAKLNGSENTASVVRWVSEKILESYKNGITASGVTSARPNSHRLPIISQIDHHDELEFPSEAMASGFPARTNCDGINGQAAHPLPFSTRITPIGALPPGAE